MSTVRYNFREWQRICKYGNVCKCTLPPGIFHTLKKKKNVTMATLGKGTTGVKMKKRNYLFNYC